MSSEKTAHMEKNAISLEVKEKTDLSEGQQMKSGGRKKRTHFQSKPGKKEPA